MSNPFPAKFDSKCQSCGEKIFEDENTYAVDGQFVCAKCAEENGNVCECGNFKKEEYDQCFECYEEEKDDAEQGDSY